MDVSEAQVATARSSRYLVQLATHLDHLRDLPHTHAGPVRDRPTVTSAEWTDTDATVSFGGALHPARQSALRCWGRCGSHSSRISRVIDC